MAASLALFMPLVPGEVGAGLAAAFTGLSALATATATTTALNNLTPAPDKAAYAPEHAAIEAPTAVYPQIGVHESHEPVSA